MVIWNVKKYNCNNLFKINLNILGNLKVSNDIINWKIEIFRYDVHKQWLTIIDNRWRVHKIMANRLSWFLNETN